MDITQAVCKLSVTTRKSYASEDVFNFGQFTTNLWNFHHPALMAHILSETTRAASTSTIADNSI